MAKIGAWRAARVRTGAVSAATAVAVLLTVAGPAVVASAAEPAVSLGPVKGTFYPNPQDSGAFDYAQVAHPMFRETFGAIAFNPASASGVGCSNKLTVSQGMRPFRDVQPVSTGSKVCTAVVAAGNGQRAGVGGLASFGASFVSTLHVPAKGDVTLQVSADDGWLLGIGGSPRPQRVSGTWKDIPSSGVSAVLHAPLVGGFNAPEGASSNAVTVHFDAAGTYPLELDYTECCGDGLTLVLSNSAGKPVPAYQSVPVQPRHTLGSGNPASNLPKECKGDPVDCATGNFTETATDLVVPGRGPALAWERSFNAQDNDPASSGLLGVGWSAAYGMHLEQDPDTGMVTVVQENGASVDFAPTDTGYAAAPWVLATLVRNGDGTFTFTRRARSTFTFTAAGLLSSIADLNGETTRLGYDSAGHLASVADAAGRVLAVSTDSTGRVRTVIDPLGRTVTYEYDSAGDLVSVTDPAGGITRYTYDDAHRMTVLTDPVGASTHNSYDDTGRVVSQTDPNGGVTTFAYGDDPIDPTLSTTTITDPTGVVSQTVFSDYQPVQHTLGLGTAAPRTWTYGSDPATLGVSTVTDPLGRTTTSGYDEHGNLLSLTQPSGASSTFSYDSLDDLLTETDPLGVTTTHSYDGHGNLTASSWPLSTGGQASSTLTYGDPAHPGDVTALTDPNGHTSHLSYTSAGQLATVTSPLGRISRFDYDQAGQLLRSTQPSGAVTASTYDLLGDPIRTVDALGHLTLTQYDALGRPVASVDAAGHLTRTVYDPAGQVIATVRPDGNVLRNGYDGAGRLVAQTDAAGHLTRYGYDSLGQLSSTTLPTGAVTRFGYDGAGQLTASTDALGRVTSRDYTVDGLLAAVQYSDGHTPNVTYTYDAAGQRTAMTDGTGTSSYTYTPTGQLAGMTTGSGQQLGYSYDSAGQLVSLRYPDGRIVSHGYDPDGQQVSLNDGHGGVFQYSYTPDGLLAQQQAPNGVTTRYGYDLLDQLTSIRVSHGPSRLLSLAYQRTATGLLAAQTGAGSHGDGQAIGTAQRYGYDLLDRLTRASGPGTSTQAGLRYRYDSTGNLTGVAGPGAHRDTLSYTSQGILTRLTVATGRHTQADVSFGYDLLGQRTSTTLRAGRHASAALGYSYDQAGRLVRYTGPVGGLGLSVDNPTGELGKPGARVSAGYTYNGDGTRTAKTVNGRTITFVYDPTSGVPTLLTSTGAAASHPGEHGKGKHGKGKHDAKENPCPPAKHDHAAKTPPGHHGGTEHGGKPDGGKPADGKDHPTSPCPPPPTTAVGTDFIYGPDGSPIEQATSGKVLYLHQDQLGATRLLTNTAGGAVARYDYTPYGTLRSDKKDRTQPVTPLLYAGSYRDAESGLYYLQARYFDPSTAQFLSRDPLEAVTGQPYVYVASSPLNGTDPLGLMLPGGDGTPAPHATTAKASAHCGGSALAQLLLRPLGLAYDGSVALGDRVASRPSILGRLLRTGTAAQRSAAAASLRGAARLSKYPWARGLRLAGKVAIPVDFAVEVGTNLADGKSVPRTITVATSGTAGGWGGAMAGGAVGCTSGAATGPGDLIICPGSVIIGAFGGSAVGDWLGNQISDFFSW